MVQNVEGKKERHTQKEAQKTEIEKMIKRERKKYRYESE